ATRAVRPSGPAAQRHRTALEPSAFASSTLPGRIQGDLTTGAQKKSPQATRPPKGRAGEIESLAEGLLLAALRRLRRFSARPVAAGPLFGKLPFGRTSRLLKTGVRYELWLAECNRRLHHHPPLNLSATGRAVRRCGHSPRPLQSRNCT